MVVWLLCLDPSTPSKKVSKTGRSRKTSKSPSLGATTIKHPPNSTPFPFAKQRSFSPCHSMSCHPTLRFHKAPTRSIGRPRQAKDLQSLRCLRLAALGGDPTGSFRSFLFLPLWKGLWKGFMDEFGKRTNHLV